MARAKVGEVWQAKACEVKNGVKGERLTFEVLEVTPDGALVKAPADHVTDDNRFRLMLIPQMGTKFRHGMTTKTFRKVSDEYGLARFAARFMTDKELFDNITDEED